MTIRIPPENAWDKILRVLGKERLVVIPPTAVRICNELGPYVQVIARRESFFTALFRLRRTREDFEESDMIPQQVVF